MKKTVLAAVLAGIIGITNVSASEVSSATAAVEASWLDSIVEMFVPVPRRPGHQA